MKKSPFTSTRVTRRSFLKLLGGTTAATALSACGTSSSPTAQEDEPTADTEQTTSEPRRGGVLRVAFPPSNDSLDPAFLSSFESWNASLAVHETLVHMDNNLALQPLLATAWEPSEDGLTWTFTLREGVTFHDGTPFTADDVAFSFNRILDPDLGSIYARQIHFVERVTAVDEQTVAFTLRSPNLDLPAIITMPTFGIVKHDRSDDDIASEPIGTGPFRLTEYMPDERVHLARHESYWQEGLPYLDEVQHIYLAEEVTRVSSLGDGTVDAIWQLGVESIPVVEAQPDTIMTEVPSGSFQEIFMKVTEPPFDDVRVRQALKHCVDREGMIQGVLQGYGTIGNDQPVSPLNPFWADIPPLEYDVERARELLAEAGHADGLTVTLTTTNSRPGMLESAIVLQEMAKAAGITIELEREPPGTYWADWQELPFGVGNIPTVPSTDELLTMMNHSEGLANPSTSWHTPEVNGLIEAARAETDETRRQELYREAQQIISRDGARIIAYYRPLFTARRSQVQNLNLIPTSMFDFREVWLAEA